MKKALVKLSTLALAMGFVAAVYADESTIPATTPGAFSASITGLYLQPSANNLTYAIYTTPLPVPAPNWTQESVTPGYSPAVDLGMQYTLADGVDQVSLDWLYVNTSNSNSVGTNVANTSVAPPYYFGPLAQSLLDTSANSTADFNVNNVNLAFGHFINLSNHIQLEPFVALNAAYLKQNIVSNYAGKDQFNFPYAITTNNTSTFTGVGPRLGFSGTYFVTSRFGITAEMAASLLVGSMESNSTFYAYDADPAGGNTTPATTALADQSQTKIVPEIDSNLGLTYTIPFNTPGSNLTLQAGYLFSAYINGINQVVPASLVPGAFDHGTIAIETEATQESDLDLNGPYLKLSYAF